MKNKQTGSLMILILSFVFTVSFSQDIRCQDLSDTDKIMLTQNPWAFIDAKLMSEIKEYGDSAPAFFWWLICAASIVFGEEFLMYKLFGKEFLDDWFIVEGVMAMIVAVFPTRPVVAWLNGKSEVNALTKFLDNYSPEVSNLLPIELKSLFDALYLRYQKEGKEFIKKMAQDVIHHIKTMPRISVSISGDVVILTPSPSFLLLP